MTDSRYGAPQDSTVFIEMLVAAMHRWGSRTLFDQPAGERSYSYSETAERIAQLTVVLQAHGVGRGDGVGVLTINCPEAWMAAIAPQAMGGYYCALPARASVDDLVYMINKAKLRAVVVHPALAELAAQVVPSCPDLKAVFTLGSSDLGLDALRLAEAVGARRLETATGLRPDDMCNLWFTGGTTGRPKAAVHTQRSWGNVAPRYFASYELPSPIRYGALGPLSHSGYPLVQPTVLAGGSVTVMPFDPERFFAVAADRGINLSIGVPTMLYAMLDVAEALDIRSTPLQRFIYGGAPMSSDRLGRLLDRFGRIFTALYGTSESIGAGTALLSDEHDVQRPERLLSCGRVVPGVTLAVLDDDLAPVAPGEVGEVCTRAPSMMDGYFEEPEMTADAFAGGWFHTGDLAKVDDEGYFTLVDRKKDMVISGGFNVYPAEIENVLMDHPGVEMAAIIGIPHDRWGEAVHAVIVRSPTEAIDENAVIELVRERKGPVYAPKSVQFVASLPLTPAGKVDKRALRAPYWVDRERAI